MSRLLTREPNTQRHARANQNAPQTGAASRNRARAGLSLVAALLAGSALIGCDATPASTNGSETAQHQVRIALDWTPNTNHTPLFVAEALGYFRDEGIDVTFLDYSTAGSDTVLDSGNAELGVSFHDGSILAQTAGANVVTVLALQQDWTFGLGVMASNTRITRPKDLDGATFASTGGPIERALVTELIRADGGEGTIDVIELGAAAYEAVETGKADAVLPFIAWQGLQAERAGTPYRIFSFGEAGLPKNYSTVLNANPDWVATHREDAVAAVRAILRGAEYTADHPVEAAELLIAAHPGLFPDESLVIDSQRILSERYLRDERGEVGTITPQGWAALGSFLYAQGALVDEAGTPLTREPDWNAQIDTTLVADARADRGKP